MLGKRMLAVGLLIVGCGMAAAVGAQGLSGGMQGMQAGISAQMKKNKAELRQYLWKQRVEVEFKGEDKSTKLDQLHYDASGEIVRVPLSAPPPPAGQPEARDRRAHQGEESGGVEGLHPAADGARAAVHRFFGRRSRGADG